MPWGGGTHFPFRVFRIVLFFIILFYIVVVVVTWELAVLGF